MVRAGFYMRQTRRGTRVAVYTLAGGSQLFVPLVGAWTARLHTERPQQAVNGGPDRQG
jgi:hypothetical protein